MTDAQQKALKQLEKVFAACCDAGLSFMVLDDSLLSFDSKTLEKEEDTIGTRLDTYGHPTSAMFYDGLAIYSVDHKRTIKDCGAR